MATVSDSSVVRETSDRRRTPLRTTCAQPHACPRPVRLAVLRHAPFFADLDADGIADVDAHAVVLSWAAGDAVYTEGEPGGHLYLVAHGQAKAYQDTEDGRTVVVDLLAPGDMFGGFDTLGKPEYGETVEAFGTLCALRISDEDFREILVRYPEVALRVVDDLAGQLGDARTTVLQQSTRTVAERVAATLLRIADKFGEARSGFGGDDSHGTLLQLPLTRVDLAGMTGSTPESVSRVMSRLRREGIIDSGRRWTAVLDRDRLAEIAGT
ncbi:Crp/Fnr family transcriptional regulator [Dietzia alimentaria]|uniref:Crp/Fnr family transcriptional regulator n=1 Tax=Dietzia alimentaria TaxID=665550 RepID=UPI000299F84B|nr:Crp/Fnr family transcriptional regulator [Dietzia alimentaria]